MYEITYDGEHQAGPFTTRCEAHDWIEANVGNVEWATRHGKWEVIKDEGPAMATGPSSTHERKSRRTSVQPALYTGRIA